MFGKSCSWPIVALLVLLALVLGACSQAPAPASAPAAPQVVKETVVVEKEVEKIVEKPIEKNVVVTATPLPEPVKAAKPKGSITVWAWKSAIDSITKSGAMDDFAKEYPDIKVEFVDTSPQDMYQKLPLALTAGSGGPDVAYVEDSHVSQFVDMGGLTDLTDRVKPYLDKMNAYKWPASMKDGKNYGMPLDSGPVVFFYRRDVFKNAGLPDDPESVSKLVATWDDYLKTCQTIKEKTGLKCFPSNKANNDARIYETMLWQQGLGYVNDKGEVTIDSPENIATLEKLGEFWKADLLSDEQPWTDSWYAAFSSPDKPVASLVEAAWMGAFLKGFIAPGTAGKWGVAQMPAFKAGQVRSANDGGSGFVIPDQSKNKDAAWAFVEFIAGQPDSQNKLFAYNDFFPALETAYTSPLFVEPDSFFGGQTTRKAFLDAVRQVPKATVYGPNYNEINRYVQLAIQKYATGQASADAALKEAATTVRQQLNLQ